MLPGRLLRGFRGGLEGLQLGKNALVRSSGRPPRLARLARQLDAAPRHYYSSSGFLGPDGRPRHVDMRQGNKISHVLSKGEFERRLDKLRSYMASEGIGASVLTSYHNVNYFSGLVYCAMGRRYALVVTKDTSTFVSSSVDGGLPWRRAIGADEHVAYTDWHQDNFFQALGKLLDNSVGDVGIEFDHASLEAKSKLDSFNPCTKVDISTATMRMRVLKSEEEIAVIREGARIAEVGGTVFVEGLREGVPEYEIALASTAAMTREIMATFPEAETTDTWSFCQSGINSDGAHNWPTSRTLQKGDIILLNCFPMISGYFAALERTLFLDHVSDAHLKMWEVNCEVHKRGLELIQPGVRCSDVANALNEIYQQYDLLKFRTFGYGHSFGVISHYYGREPDLELREDIHTVLQPGMVLSMEPMILIPEGQPGAGGYREHDTIVVHENGTEILTTFPYGPELNVIKA